MSLRRILALALLVPVTCPTIRGFSVLTRADSHACNDGMCRCGHARPDRPAAPAPCHDSENGSGSHCGMSARCNHEDPAVPGTHAVALVPETAGPAVAFTAARALPTRSAGIHAGFSRIDSPPPRLA